MNYRHFLGSLLAGAALLAACSQDQPQQQSGTPAATSSPADSTAQDTTTAISAAATPAPGTRTVYQLLQGKWQSTTDEQAVIEFQDHQYIDYYDKERLTSNPFVLDKACAGESGSGRPGDNERYLIVPADDMCWHIAVVDDSSLELEYVARGNVLTYRKIK